MPERKKEQDLDLFRSLPKEQFEQLPRPSIEEIQRALDDGRPQAGEPGTPTIRLDPAMRFF